MAGDFNVHEGTDGRLIAEGWHGYSCDRCEAYHIELLDREEQCFAVMTIRSEDMVPLARILMSIAAELHEHGKIKMPMPH